MRVAQLCVAVITVMVCDSDANISYDTYHCHLINVARTLEICACIAVVDGSETKNIQQIMNAVTILFLAL